MTRKVNMDLNYGEDFIIIGISCHRFDYWIAGNLNDALKLKLTRQPDLPVYNPGKNIALKYPLFHYIKPDDQTAFSLVSNYNPEGKLFPDQKSFDYFLLVNGKINDGLLSKWLSVIKKTPQVLIAHKLNVQKVKNHKEFFSDFELHLIEIAGKKKNKNYPV
jgi:hypothetical protein